MRVSRERGIKASFFMLTLLIQQPCIIFYNLKPSYHILMRQSTFRPASKFQAKMHETLFLPSQ